MKSFKNPLESIMPPILCLSFAKTIPISVDYWNEHKWSYKECIFKTIIEYLSKLNSKEIPINCHRDRVYVYTDIGGHVKWYNDQFQFVKFLRILDCSLRHQARILDSNNAYLDCLRKSDVSYIRQNLGEYLLIKRIHEKQGAIEIDFNS